MATYEIMFKNKEKKMIFGGFVDAENEDKARSIGKSLRPEMNVCRVTEKFKQDIAVDKKEQKSVRIKPAKKSKPETEKKKTGK